RRLPACRRARRGRARAGRLRGTSARRRRRRARAGRARRRSWRRRRARRRARERLLLGTGRSSTSRFPSDDEGTERSGRRFVTCQEGFERHAFRCIYYISGVVLKVAVTVLAAAGIACAASPAAQRTHTIAPGVKVLDTR